MSSATFTLVVYQANPRGGFDQVTFTLDERLTIVKEARETVPTYSVREAHRAFTKALVNSGPVLRLGIDAELKVENDRVTAEIMQRETERLAARKRVAIPDEAAKKGLQILVGEDPPCDGNPACLKLRDEYKAAIAKVEAAAAADNRVCRGCETGPITEAFQKKLLDAGFTK